MALAFWARLYGVEPPTALQAGVTRDLDFLGTALQAEAFADRLRERYPHQVDLKKATLDDPPPSAAKILLREFHGRSMPLEIDYLTGLTGVPSKERLVSRAMEVRIGPESMQVMHPVDCLITRVENAERLPAKRTPQGYAQCRLAIEVAAAFMREACARNEQRTALDAAELVIALAFDDAGRRLAVDQGIDVLHAIPVEQMPEMFRTVRWPQVQERAADRRQAVLNGRNPQAAAKRRRKPVDALKAFFRRK